MVLKASNSTVVLKGRRPFRGLLEASSPTPPVFSPDDIASISNWFDATDASTISETSGSVTEWRNKVSGSPDLTQSVAANQPTTGTRTLNGRNVIDFNGTTDCFVGGSSLNATNFTIFVVGARDQANRNDWPVGANTSISSSKSRLHLGFRSDGDSSFSFWGGDLDVAGAAVGAGESFLLTGILDDTSDENTLRQNGSEIGSNSPATQFVDYSWQVGKLTSSYFDGVIAEIVAYNAALSASEIAQVETYLNDKYGVY